MIDFYSTKDGHVPKFQLKAAYAKNFLNYKTKLNIESKILPKHLTSIACTVGNNISNMMASKYLDWNRIKNNSRPF